MKPQSTQKLFAFIITILSISSSFAQCKKNQVLQCYISRSCSCLICNCVPAHGGNGNHFISSTTPSDLSSISLINSTSINVALTEPQTISLKIYDATGRLIKTLANGRMRQGEYQIDWNKKDENGNLVSPGMYILHFDAGTYSDNKKIAVFKA